MFKRGNVSLFAVNCPPSVMLQLFTVPAPAQPLVDYAYQEAETEMCPHRRDCWLDASSQPGQREEKRNSGSRNKRREPGQHGPTEQSGTKPNRLPCISRSNCSLNLTGPTPLDLTDSPSKVKDRPPLEMQGRQRAQALRWQGRSEKHKKKNTTQA